MKKLVSIALVSSLVLSSATFAFASPGFMPPGLAKKGGMPPGIAKKFMDIDSYEWAREAIERMAEKEVIKGIGEGLFAPQKQVTKLEAVVMALRVMGEEPTARVYLDQIKLGKKSFKLKGKIQDWSYGYVKLAEEKGILEEYELVDFNLNQPAKRHEVAKYMLRAAGYKEEAEEYMDEDLDFVDAPAIPTGSVGYVYLAEDMGLIKGYNDNTFRPNQPVTRAEMAVMIDRLDGKDIDEDEDDYEIYRGDVTDLDTAGSNKSIELDDDEVFTLTDDTEVVFEDDVEGDIYDIKLEDEVKVKVNEDDEATYIEVDRHLYEEFEGEVTDLDTTGSSKSIELDDDEVFTLTDDTEVVFKDDVEGDIYDIKLEDEVKVKVNEDDEATYIEVDRYLYEEFEGEVTDLDTTGSNKSIELDDDDVFKLTDDTKVVFEDEVKGDIYDLKLDDEVKVRVNKDDEVISIEVDRELEIEKYTGTIVDIEEDDDEFDFTIYTSKKFVDFTVDDDFVVEFDDEDGTITDVRIGDEVEVILDDEEVEKIIVDRDIDSELSNGTIIDIYEDEEQILVKNNNKYTTISIDEDTKIYLNGDRVSFSKLEEDDNITFELDGDIAIEINAYRLVLE